MKYTYTGIHCRSAGLVIGSIVIKKGETVEVDAASHEVYKKLKSVKSLIESGDLEINGDSKAASTDSKDPKENAPAKPETKAEKTARLKAEKEAAEKAGEDAGESDIDALRVQLTEAGISFEDDETAVQLKEKLDNFKE